MIRSLREKASFLFAFLGKRVVVLLFVGGFLGFAFSGVEILFAAALQSFLGELGVQSSGDNVFDKWFPALSLEGTLWILFAVGAVRAAFQWLQMLVPGLSLEEMKSLQRSRIVRWAFHAHEVSTSRTMTLFTERVNHAGSGVMSFQSLVIRAVTCAFLAYALFILSPIVTLIALGSLLLTGLFTRSIDRRIISSSEGIRSHWDVANAKLVRSIRNLLLIRIYGVQHEEEQRAQESLQRYRQDYLRYHHLSGVKFALPHLLGSALICVIASFLVKEAKMGAGNIVAYLYLFVRFVQCFAEVVKFSSLVTLYAPQFRQLTQWWRETAPEPGPPSRDEKDALSLPVALPLGIRLGNIRFRYRGEPHDVLEGFSLRVEPGSTWVVTGPSGSGKSTLLGIILGLHKPQSGEAEVLWQGGAAPLSSVQRALLDRVGYVGPESFLLEGTVRENLLFGLKRASSEGEIEEALRIAECHFLLDLPRGLDHRLSEQGEGLSSGQKQRLGLARALLRNPSILILDEATSNLDRETEARVIQSLSKLKGKMTLLIVTHRDSFRALSDHALSMDVLDRVES